MFQFLYTIMYAGNDLTTYQVLWHYTYEQAVVSYVTSSIPKLMNKPLALYS